MVAQAKKVEWPVGFTLETAITSMADYLEEQGYEVNRVIVGWRVLMYRRDDRQWSQVHGGLTRRGGATRQWVTVTGPEDKALLSLDRPFYSGGLFAALGVEGKES